MIFDAEDLLSMLKRPPRGKNTVVIYSNKSDQCVLGIYAIDEPYRFRLILGNDGRRQANYRGVLLSHGHHLLSRIELCGIHSNPSFDPSPGYEWLIPFQRMRMVNIAHIHFVIDGLGDQWAVPLEAYFPDFDLHDETIALQSFCRYCGLEDRVFVCRGLF